MTSRRDARDELAPPPVIAIYGATGVVGRRVCAQLVGPDVRVVLVGRHADALVAIAADVPGAIVRVAAADDPAALARAFAGARVVVNVAGPAAAVGDGVLIAALAAGAHYVDSGGDQAFLAALYERHESTARHAGLVAVPGAGVDCVLGDFAAAWAATQLCGDRDDAPVRRTEPVARRAEDRPLDDVAISYILDDLALSAASQRTLFANLSARAQRWRRDRWEAAPAGERRRVNAGTALGGERDAVTFAAGDPLTIPRHLAAHTVQAFVSTTRRPVAATALRLLARALPMLPRGTSELLGAYAPPETDYARTRFAVIAQVRRGFAAAQVAIGGHDLYRTTAVIAAWIARQLATRAAGAGPVGMRAPSELFGPRAALAEIAKLAELTIEPSFG